MSLYARSNGSGFASSSGGGGGGSAGTVTSVSVTTLNGFSGTVVNPTTTPAITLATTVTGILLGNGTSVSAAPTTGAGNVVLSTNPVLTGPSLGTPLTLIGTNITGTAASFNIGGNAGTATSLTGGASGSLPYQSATSTTAMLPIGSTGNVLTVVGGLPAWAPPATSGTVTSVSVVSANGLSGTVATATTTPAITLSTSITGILQGNGTAISAASTTGTGSVVLATSPTLVTPNIGVATGTSLVLTDTTTASATSVSGARSDIQITADSPQSNTVTAYRGSYSRTIATTGTTDTSTVGVYTAVAPGFSIPTGQVLTNNTQYFGFQVTPEPIIVGGGSINFSNWGGLKVNSSSASTGLVKTGILVGAMSGATNNAIIADGTAFTGNFALNFASTSPSVFAGSLASSNLTAAGHASADIANALVTTTGDLIYASAASTPARLAIGSTNNVLTVVGGVPTWQPPATSGTVTSVSATVPAFLSIAGSPITSSGTLAISLSGTALPVLNGGTGTTTSTGTGSVVLSASPTLTGTLSASAITASGQLIGGGTTTNNNASAGQIGEYVQANVLQGSAVTLTSGASTTIMSISLTAGDWDVTAICGYTGTGVTAINYLQSAINNVTNSLAGVTLGMNWTQSNGNTNFYNQCDSYLIIPNYRISLATTTTYYMISASNYTGGTTKAYGTLNARRVR